MTETETQFTWREAFTVQNSMAVAVSKGQFFMATPGHGEVIHLSAGALKRYFKDQPDVFIATDVHLCSNPRNLRKFLAPDLMVARARWGRAETTYRTWEAPVPHFVLEVASPSTVDRDLGSKKADYELLKVYEYWQVDPSGDLLPEPLMGYRLAGKSYQPIRPSRKGPGKTEYWSEALGLYLRPKLGRDGVTVLYRDPITGKDILVGNDMTLSYENQTKTIRKSAQRIAELESVKAAGEQRSERQSRRIAELESAKAAGEQRSERHSRRIAELEFVRVAAEQRREEDAQRIAELESTIEAFRRRHQKGACLLDEKRAAERKSEIRIAELREALRKSIAQSEPNSTPRDGKG